MADVRTAQEVELRGLEGTTLATVVSVGTSATALPSSILTNRKTVILRNVGTADVFLGGSGVTTSSGLPLEADDVLTVDLATAAIYGIVASGTNNVAVLEVS